MENIITKLEALASDITPEEQKEMACFKEHFETFFAKYNLINPKNIINISFADVITSAFIIELPEQSTYILEMACRYSDLFEDDEIFAKCFDPLMIYHHNPELHKIKISSNPLKLVNTSKQIVDFCAKNNFDSEYIIIILEFIAKNPTLYPDLAPLLDIDETKINEAIEFYWKMSSCKEVSEKEEIPEKHLNEFLKKSSLLEYFNNLYTKYNSIIKNYNKKCKDAKKHNSKLTELITILKSSEEIEDVNYVLTLCPKEELKPEIVDYIIAHNKKYYEDIINRLEALKTPTEANFKLLFASFNYDYNSLNSDTKKQLKTKSYSDIAGIFQIFKDLNIPLPLNLISEINLEYLSKINDLIKDGYINLEFLNNHIALILNDNALMPLLLDNLALLRAYGINIRTSTSSLAILLSPILAENLNILTSYGLSITKQTSDINFLAKKDLENIISLAIELDLPLDNLDILNYSEDELYNYQISLQLNIPFTYLKSNPIYKAYEDFIPEAIKAQFLNRETKIPMPLELKPFIENNYFLNIEGIKVAKRRLLSNLSKLPEVTPLNIFYALIYNSYYSLNQILRIKSTIVPDYQNILTLKK